MIFYKIMTKKNKKVKNKLFKLSKQQSGAIEAISLSYITSFLTHNS